MSIKTFLFHYLPDVLYCKEANYIKQQWFCYRWIKRHIKWAYQNVQYDDTVMKNKIEPNVSIFMYWKQGWDNAPDIVKLCMASVHKHRNGHPLVLLDENNIKDYVSLPEYIECFHQKGIIKEALYSDILRICLLIKYGGYWLDATCYLSAPIPKNIENSGFFMFSKTLLPEWSSPIKGSSWFIKSNRNNLILKYVRNFLFNYWLHNRSLINYYIFHISLSAIVDDNKECYELWNSKPYICNMNPHVLLYSFGQTYETSSFEHIVHSSFVHKLSYKFSPSLLKVETKNILQHLIESLS